MAQEYFVLFEGNGIFWASLAAGLLGLLLGKLYSQVAKMIRSSQMLAGMPKPPEKVTSYRPIKTSPGVASAGKCVLIVPTLLGLSVGSGPDPPERLSMGDNAQVGNRKPTSGTCANHDNGICARGIC